MKLHQGTLRELFLLVALASMGWQTSGAETEAPKITEKAKTLSMEELQRMIPAPTKASAMYYDGSDTEFDYFTLRSGFIAPTNQVFKVQKGPLRIHRFNVSEDDQRVVGPNIFPASRDAKQEKAPSVAPANCHRRRSRPWRK